MAVWLLLAALVGAPAAYLYTREPSIDVTVMTLRRGRVEQTIAAFSAGSVEPKRSSMVSAETIGKVTAIPVQKGDRVKAGDVLVELENGQQTLQARQAEAQMHQLELAVRLLDQQRKNDEARVLTLKRTRDLAAYEFSKDKTLYEDTDVGSESMVNLSELNFNQMDDAYVAVNNLVNLYPLRIEEAGVAVTAGNVMLDLARLSLDWTKVRAPFAGLVADIYVEIGESVGGGLGGGLAGGAVSGKAVGPGLGGAMPSMTAPGMSMGSAMAVVHLVDDSDLYVKAPFDEAVFGQLKMGQKVRVSIDAYRNEDFPGRVSAIAATVSRNVDLSRTFEVEVLIESGKEKLIPGMSADVIVVAEEKEDVLLVPTEALVREEEGYVIENGRAVRRRVEVGIGNWQQREVLGGLREGDMLVTSVGLRELRDGVKVNIVESLEAR